MGVSAAIILIFTLISLIWVYLNTANATSIISVLDYGAIGDGEHDDSEAFSKAWNAACHTGGYPSMVIPQGKTFLLNPIIFNGSCTANVVSVEVYGTIVAPEDPNAWEGIDHSTWLGFNDVNGLNISGSGKFDGRGYRWWNQSCKYNEKPDCTKLAPTTIKFFDCKETYISEIHLVRSPQTHVSLIGCNGFHITQVNINSPGDAPNTDGIHIQSSHHVNVNNSSIKCGDDCVSIGDETSDIRIENIRCGPGHGVSIGSLGKDGTNVSVEDIHVNNVTFEGTTNGARIKTWQGAKGYARGISFKKLNFLGVENPIIIDQFYCAKAGECTSLPTGVQISNVTYEEAIGTSETQVAINLNCSQAVPCTGLTFASINLTSAIPQQSLHSECVNAKDISTDEIVKPEIHCSSSR